MTPLTKVMHGEPSEFFSANVQRSNITDAYGMVTSSFRRFFVIYQQKRIADLERAVSSTLALRKTIARNRPVTEDEPDRQLVLRAKTESSAFAALYARYADPIFRHCYRRLGSREAAEDATSQVFTQALAALPKFDASRDAFRSWLFTIAHHVLADMHRTERGRSRIEIPDEAPDTGRSPEELAIAREGERSLRAAMALLPSREREVVELRLAGLTGPEIGAVLGCRRGAVGAAHYRAVNRLRSLLGAEARAEGHGDG